MAATWTRALVPKRLRKPIDALRLLRATGVLGRPALLIAQLRARRGAQRLQRALFYHRYATAALLAHEAGVFEALAGHALVPDELARACDLRPRAAAALLRILESQEIVVRDGEAYGLSHLGRVHLLRSAELSMAPTLDIMAAQAAAFSDVREGLRTGRPPAELDIFRPDARCDAFLDAVNDFLYWAGVDLLHQIQLPRVESLIVGSMGVSFSARVLERFPNARVTYGCLEHLVREVPRLRERYHVPEAAVEGMHAHGGDPAADRWGDEAFDLVLLTKKMILEPEQRTGEKFATKAFDVLRPGGAAILWETVHPSDRPTPLPRAMEAVMDLIASPDGPLNDERDLRAMLARIGYRDVEVVPCLGGQTTFVVARKPS